MSSGQNLGQSSSKSPALGTFSFSGYSGAVCFFHKAFGSHLCLLDKTWVKVYQKSAALWTSEVFAVAPSIQTGDIQKPGV